MSDNPNADIIRHSVTRDDYAKEPSTGLSSTLNLWFPMPSQQGDLPAYWSPLRDRVLRTTIMR